MARDRNGNVYVTNGYGNSRVLRFDKFRPQAIGLGNEGSGPEQFDTPHTIVIDGELVRLMTGRTHGSRSLTQVAGSYGNGNLGHPFGLVLMSDEVVAWRAEKLRPK